MITGIGLVLLIALGLLAAYLLLPPIVVFGTIRQPANPNFSPIWFENIPRPIGDLLMERTEAIVDLGFQQVSHLKPTHEMPNTSTYVTLLANQRTGDLAAVMYIETIRGEATTRASAVEFSATMPDGSIIDTTNSSQPRVTPLPPEHRLNQLPSVHDPASLYRAHRAIMRSIAGSTSPVLPQPGREVEEFNRAIVKDLAQQVRFGYFVPEPATASYRLTWKGAFLMTWRLMWPFNVLGIRRNEARVRQLLASVEPGLLE